VEMHTGSVVGRSDGVGKGCEFLVRLPISREQPGQFPIQKADVITSTMTRHRVLVVDDNRDGADAMAMALQLSGNDTATAYDGLEAILKAQSFHPDVILLDIGLPGMDGNDTCRKIREEPWGRDLVLIAITGWGQEEDRRASREAGFDAHLVKPVIHSELVKLIASCISLPVEERMSMPGP
jgi:CheY-like chemotaxis protein